MSRFSYFYNNLANLFRRKAYVAIAGAVSFGGALYMNNIYSLHKESTIKFKPLNPLLSVQCTDDKVNYQKIVIAENKQHALFLIIHFDSPSSNQNSIQALKNIQNHVNLISPEDIRDDDNELIVGIGFGPEFLKNLCPNIKNLEDFKFQERTTKNASMPSTGGDILIHAVCSEYGKLFELADAIISDLSTSKVANIEEFYGFTYRNGRDLSGFIDGTENPADEDERIDVAVNKTTGGSYAITQRWVHELKTVKKETDSNMEKYIGRTKADSIQLKPIPTGSHLGRMVKDVEKKHIVRHSMPYGSVTGECGLFFIAYSSTPTTFNWMLDRMTGKSEDKNVDSLFQFTKPVSGAYFYMPSDAELSDIFKATKRNCIRFW